MATINNYDKTVWLNGNSPAINDSNLNKIENGIYDNRGYIQGLNTDIETLGTDIDTLITCSSTERVVGKWIDNKPLYQKTFYFSSNSSISISDLNISRGFINFALSSIDVTYSGGTSRHIAPVQISTGSYSSQSSVFFNSNYSSITLEKGSNVASTSGYVTINYTKTTD